MTAQTHVNDLATQIGTLEALTAELIDYAATANDSDLAMIVVHLASEVASAAKSHSGLCSALATEPST